MDDRPRQVLKQLLAKYRLALCDQPGRCRGLLLDELEGACEAEVNTLLLTLQYGIVEELREVAGPQIPELLLSQLVQKLRRRVPLDESAAHWAVEVWAEALALCLSALPLSPLPPVSSPYSAASSPPSLYGRHTPQQHIPRTSRFASASSLPPLPIPSPTLHNSLGMGFVLIPAGTSQMGSNDRDAWRNEQPVHTVRITKPFYLSKHEVTQGQWQAAMGGNPSRFTGDPHRPVEQVSWNDVQTFIRRLNAQERKMLYRLPTEAEWEYAARAGTRTRWSFGEDASQLGLYAWYGDNADNRTHPVGQLQPNPWGLYDMHGNIWEWVEDRYESYTAGPAVDPMGPFIGWYRANRGGGWNNHARLCRSANRNADPPDHRSGSHGFRLLRTVE